VVTVAPAEATFLPRERFDALLDLLREGGRTVIGPTLRDGAVMLGEIATAADLPVGWRDEQSPGHYRLSDGHGPRLFDVVNGPQSWKQMTFPPRVTVGRAEKTGGGKAAFAPAPLDPERLAFLGVRACELAALGVHDRVLAGGTFVDEDYRARRSAAIVVAVQCTRAGATCFCASMGTGPEVRSGHDLVLTELDDGFVVDSGSPAGDRLVARLPGPRASAAQLAAASGAVAATRAAMGDAVAVDGLRDRLMDKLDSPRWAEIADRCLACANCTMVCPTCFCTSTTVHSDLDGTVNLAEREWDSCFNVGFAKVAGGNFRPNRSDRYRQWLTHKFATWYDQFGTSGCVGCGRCVTWCPVGIDVREELSIIAPPAAPISHLPARPAAATAGRFDVATLREIHAETEDTRTLRLVPGDPALLGGLPGQFVMVEQPGFPAFPISVSRYGTEHLFLTVRAAGPATAGLLATSIGGEVGLRGPLGRAWPLDRALGRDVVIATGGIGLAPLRPLIDALLAERDRFGAITLAYGARTPGDRLFRDELSAWAARGIEVLQIVDRSGPGWTGHVGVVTNLLDQRDFSKRPAVGFVCGPERMMQATTRVLRDAGITPERIFVSLERHMECGIGLCGHCQMGPFFICKDGPVFSLAELGDLFAREGI
jgi:NAD(P)H-flavin reductase/Pyruvate/2-oxoacid:ferredoxin oxidoreductase delta subunit